MNFFERVLETVAVVSLCAAVFVVCYAVGSFVSLVARLVGVSLL